MQPLLRAEEIGLLLANHLHHPRTPLGPRVHAKRTGVTNIKRHYREGLSGLGLLNERSDEHMKERNNDKAIFYFEKALIKKQDFTQAQYNLAKVYTELGDELQLKDKFEDAIKNYELAIKNKFDFVDAYNNLGITLEKLNRFDDAKNIFPEITRNGLCYCFIAEEQTS